MKCLTLYQPWASMMFVGDPRYRKSVETRGWTTSYRGPLVIHAARTWDRRLQLHLGRWIGPKLIRDWIPTGIRPILGACLGVVDLVDIRPTDEWLPESPIERELGDYSPGRFAWILENPRPLPEPYFCRGFQGFWPVPRVVRATLEQGS